MVHIIVKSSRKGFHPHYNNATGRYYHTSSDYYKDLKDRGLEPQDASTVTARKPKEYKPSQWAKDIVRSVERSGTVSGAVREELRNAEVKEVPKDLKDKVQSAIPDRPSSGGWF